MDLAAERRQRMIRTQIEARGIVNPEVLRVMENIPRHLFVPEEIRDMAYEDCALRIGLGQTISQPYIVALMTALAEPNKTDRVLEIGTGTGYQTAILAEICKSVTTIERIEKLHETARARLDEMGYDNVSCILGDGYEGNEKEAPYDIIIVTACPEEIPMKLIDQLGAGGRMVIPAGRDSQYIYLVKKDMDGQLEIEQNIEVRFVSMCHDIIESGRK